MHNEVYSPVLSFPQSHKLSHGALRLYDCLGCVYVCNKNNLCRAMEFLSPNSRYLICKSHGPIFLCVDYYYSHIFPVARRHKPWFAAHGEFIRMYGKIGVQCVEIFFSLLICLRKLNTEIWLVGCCATLKALHYHLKCSLAFCMTSGKIFMRINRIWCFLVVA